MILNYTTTVSADRTLSEIQKILVKSGATKISIDYTGSTATNLTFSIPINDTHVLYSLPCRFKGILKKLKTQSRVPKTEEQVIKVGWRIIKDWIESQLAIVDAELAELPEVFLQYAITRNGDTLYDYIKSIDQNNSLLLLK